MASRSVLLTLINQLNETLSLNGSSLDHGEWSTGMNPPSSVGPNQKVSMQSESDGFATGVEGTVSYKFSAGVASMTFNNPFGGDNSYSVSTPPGYVLSQVGGESNNANVSFTLFKQA